MFGVPSSAATGSMSGPIEFTSPRGLTPTSGTWDSSPATLSVWANDMTTSLATPSSPWKTRQSLLNLIIKGNDCGSTYSKQLYLNQTNYAMIAGSAVSPITKVKMKDTTGGQIKILSNVPWIAYTVADSPDWSVAKVLSSYTTELKDKTSSDGTTGSDDNYAYKAAAVGAGTRFTSVTVTFKDPGLRAKDIKINIEQCDGTPLIEDIYRATPEETSSVTASWLGKIVRHEAKANVYEEFYSADFGAAGRWMITNLAAKAYDGITHSAGRSLSSGPQANTNSAYNVAYWAYPGKTGLTDATEFNKNPHMGYLYTWDAATGGKGGANGKNNVDRISSGTNSWVGDRSESALPEWTGTVNATNRPKDSQKRRQGICPSGWHLPSDYEWTELEREIVRNTTKYSNVLNNIDNGNGAELGKVAQASILSVPDGSGPDTWRGSTHGQAMKDACELDFKGTSNHAAANGFSLQLPGFGDKTTAYGFGQEGMYWTSSIAHGEAAYGRKFGTDAGVYRNDVYRYRPYRYYQFSVRCKKD